MSGLIEAVRTFIAALAPDGNVATVANSISPYDLYVRLDDERRENALLLYKAVCSEVIQIYQGLETAADGDVWNEWDIDSSDFVSDSSDSSDSDYSSDEGEQKESNHMYVICNSMYTVAPDYNFKTAITLEPDPSNVYDKHAIKVMSSGRQVAWIASSAYISANISSAFTSKEIYANSSLLTVLDRVISIEFVKREKGAALLKVLYQ